MRLRLERGLSLRGLARLLGMSAHSGLVDYERGVRIPPADLARAYERALCPGDDRITRLWNAAMAERARLRMATSRPPEPAHRAPRKAPEPRRSAFPVSATRSVEGLADLLDRLAGQLRRFTDGRS